jgi:hypothetical protein
MTKQNLAMRLERWMKESRSSEAGQKRRQETAICPRQRSTKV